MIKTARHGATLQVPGLNWEHGVFTGCFQPVSLGYRFIASGHSILRHGVLLFLVILCPSGSIHTGYKMMWSYCRECGSQQARSTKITFHCLRRSLPCSFRSVLSYLGQAAVDLDLIISVHPLPGAKTPLEIVLLGGPVFWRQDSPRGD